MLMKILIVDDYERVRDILMLKIREIFPDANIEMAEDGLKGISKIRDGGVDLVVTDNQMPGMDGVDLIMMARSEGFKMPIILLSGAIHPELRSMAIKAGADAVFDKPKFLDIVKWAIEQAQKRAEARG
jgi:CheY-like chemotaxis protein